MSSQLHASELDTLRHALRSRRTTLLQDLRDDTNRSNQENYAQVIGPLRDMEDEAAADVLIDTRLAGIEREVKELEAIRDALARMETDEYGICMDCGQPISVQRLQAQPTAERDIDCQSRWEQEHQDHNPREL